MLTHLSACLLPTLSDTLAMKQKRQGAWVCVCLSVGPPEPMCACVSDYPGSGSRWLSLVYQMETWDQLQCSLCFNKCCLLFFTLFVLEYKMNIANIYRGFGEGELTWQLNALTFIWQKIFTDMRNHEEDGWNGETKILFLLKMTNTGGWKLPQSTGYS